MKGLGAVFGRLLPTSRSHCDRCGAALVVVSEERLTSLVPVFDVCYRCVVCGHATRVRQVLELPF